MTTAMAPAPLTPVSRELYRFNDDQFRRLLLAGLVTPADEPAALAGHHRFSVDQYHHLDGLAILAPDDRVELLDGLVVRKSMSNPPHSIAVQRTRKRIEGLVPSGWTVWVQDAITLATSEPEPDVFIVRGTDDDYAARHPRPIDLGLVIEVSDSTLADDRDFKGPLYARAGIVEYWVVNLVHQQIEVRTGPTAAGYATTTLYRPGDAVPLTLDGVVLGTIAVDDIVR